MRTHPPGTPLFNRHIAIPQDHGSWVFLLSPLLIGLFAGGKASAASTYVVAEALAAFFMRQPVTLAVKALSGRRALADPALFWGGLYALPGFFTRSSFPSIGSFTRTASKIRSANPA